MFWVCLLDLLIVVLIWVVGLLDFGLIGCTCLRIVGVLFVY